MEGGRERAVTSRPQHDSCLCNFYIALGIISNLEIIYKVHRRLYADTMPSYIGVGCLGEFLELIPLGYQGGVTVKSSAWFLVLSTFCWSVCLSVCNFITLIENESRILPEVLTF